MAHRYDHIRDKAILLRTEQHMTLDEITERLSLPKTTIYHWIKDIPIPRTEKQTEAQRRKHEQNRARYAALREKAYQQGLTEAPKLFQDLTFRDFVVLYMAEGTKRQRNSVAFVNSNANMVRLAHRWIKHFTRNKLEYSIQYHVDHDELELKQYWAGILGIQPAIIKTLRKSNSNKLSGRQFRSPYGLLTVRVGDTYLRAKLQAWMDYIQVQW
ncbi:MAG: hypothetical protein GC204_03885 [Chloroflexi bacterium]|nr:hypothetical protein [Chloroflexota bacterium]